MRAKKAFSLIELSIVILIVGILIAGVIFGSKVLDFARLNSARTQTQSSPVSGVSNLSLWLETTSSESFNTDPNNGDQISTWKDINSQSTIRFPASQSESSKQPTYKTNSINNLPALVFDGSDDDMVISNFSAGSNTSYFFVVQPASNQVEAIFDSAPNQMWVFRNLCDEPNYPTCTGDGAFSWWNGNNPTPQVPLGLTAQKSYILFVETKLAPNKVLTLYKNGSLVSSATDESDNDTAWSDPRIGSVNFDLTFYNGKIGEVIIYSGLLTEEERSSITSYLSKKWNIKIS